LGGQARRGYVQARARTGQADNPGAFHVNAEDRANELYWGSDRSVNQIADDLDLSKGALYEMIRPSPVDPATALLADSDRTEYHTS